MAAPPRFKAFSREDFPDAPEWFTTFLLPLNETVGGLVNALSRRLTRSENLLAAGKTGIEFSTQATVDNTWPLRLKNELPIRPSHLWATRLERADGGHISTPWSLTWRLAQSGEVEIRMQGLTASTKYRLSIAYE